MTLPFQRSSRALERERDWQPALITGASVLVLGLGVTWCFGARITLFEATDTARIEAAPGVHVVQTEVAGRVTATEVALGRHVERGDVLVELDATQERLEHAEALAKLSGLEAELLALAAERGASEAALAVLRSEEPAALREAEWRRQELVASALAAEGESERTARIRASGGASEREAAVSRADALQRRAAAAASAAAALKLRAERARAVHERMAAIASLDRARGRTVGEIAAVRARVTALERTIALRTITAPVSGRLAQVYELQVGAVLEQGSRVTAIVPAGELRVVARFPIGRALGRVRAGQRGWLRLTGFPWTEYGKVAVRVEHVGSEANEGRVRVELSVLERAPHLAHGLAGTLEVAVEQVSPAILLTRITTRKLSGVVDISVEQNKRVDTDRSDPFAARPVVD